VLLGTVMGPEMSEDQALAAVPSRKCKLVLTAACTVVGEENDGCRKTASTVHAWLSP
jgi:hypothetical protein